MTGLGLRRVPRAAARLSRREDGASALEFALISLPLVTILIGFFEFAVITLTALLLESASLEAARFGATGATPQSGTREDELRRIIEERTFGFVDMADLEIETLIYNDFSVIGQPEHYEDANGNGSFDVGESFDDVNGNGAWDQDQGRAGVGGADEIVVYSVSYDWTPLTAFMQPVTGELTLTSSIPIRNEPF
jgi:hypothetical protein